MRGHAAEALALIQSVYSVDVLLKNLEDEDPGVKYWCAFALGQIGPAKALPALKRLAESAGNQIYETYSLRAEALDAINAINQRLSGSKLRESRGVVRCSSNQLIQTVVPGRLTQFGC